MKTTFTVNLFCSKILKQARWLLVLVISLLHNTAEASAVVAGCPALSPLACDQLQVSLPFRLSFESSVAGTITDINGAGTGFTMVAPYSGTRLSADGTPSSLEVLGHEASKLLLSGGGLQLATNKGFAYLKENSQINTLGVEVNTGSWVQIDAVLVNPFNGTENQQAGLWIGLHDKTFVKLVVIGSQVELRKEVNDVSSNTNDRRITSSIPNLSTQNVRLRLQIDPVTNLVQGFYSTDGVTYLNVGQSYSQSAISLSGSGITGGTAYTGVFASHRNSNTPVTYTFDEFSITSESTNENEAPVFAASNYAYTVSDNVATGANVGTVTASDLEGSAVTYSLIGGNTIGTFVINSSTGTISLAKKVNHHTQSAFALKVKATDADGNASEADVAVTVTEGNSLPAFNTISWRTLAEQPFSTHEVMGEVVDGKLYVFGGYDEAKLPNYAPTKRLMMYDPASNTWNILADLPFAPSGTGFGGVTHAGITTDGTDIYFAGGYISNSSGTGQTFGTKQVWRYNVVSDSYTALPDLPVALAAGQLKYLNGKLHHIGGLNSIRTVNLDTHYVLDLDNMAQGWQTLAPLPVGRHHAGSTVYKGKIYYIGGGQGHDDATVTFKNVDIYDAASNAWSSAADMLVPSGTTGRDHIGSSVIVAGDKIVVLGGLTSHNIRTNLVSAYQPSSNTWSSLTPLPAALASGVGATLNGSIHYTGGNFTKENRIGSLSNASSQQVVSSLTLINADTDQDIQTLKDGAVLDLASLATRNIAIRANTNPETVGSVVFMLSGAESSSVTESVAPYALYGDNSNGDYYAWTPTVGDYSLVATPFTSSGGRGTAGVAININFKIINTSTPPITAISLINGGGGQYIDGQSRSWSSDAHFSGGETASKSFSVEGTTDDALYLSYRYASLGTPFSYSIPVEAGSYNLKVHFLEPYYGAPGGKAASGGERVFHVDVEGQRVLSNYDIYTQEGAGKAIVKTFKSISVSDGSLDLLFTSVVNNAIVSGIEIEKDTTTQSHTLTVSTTGSGTVTRDPGKTSYSVGTSVTLTATPAPGYQFAGWSGDVSGDMNPLTLTMDGDKNVSASFMMSTSEPGTQALLLFTPTAVTVDLPSGQQKELKVNLNNSDEDPVTVQLTAMEGNGMGTPAWLLHSGNTLSSENNVTYALGESGNEVLFTVDATTLAAGTYTAIVNASASGYTQAELYVTLEVASYEEGLRPSVTAVRPADGEISVSLGQSISVDVSYPSGKSIDGNTVNPGTVKLYKVEGTTLIEVAGTAVNATAAGDAITLSATLALSSTYEFFISDQVKDGNGYKMKPFRSRFKTVTSASDIPTDLQGVSFTEQVLVDRTFGSDGFTSLVIGPDKKLYAATSGGKIERWDIKADGSLTNHISISPFGSSRRLLIGLRFDPSASATDLVAWMSHSSPEFSEVPDWTGKVSRIDLTNPASPVVTDYVINLPRSYKDHATNSIDFGPDGALYFPQGGNTAMGVPDGAWGHRPERLLSAAVLRLDIVKAQQQSLPIDAKTEEGGTYNPNASNAPLTIYATGIRNAYDLVWHTNGQLYVPTNGSAAGGNTPALMSGTMWSNGQVYTGPDIPAMMDVRDTQSDYLFRVEKGGYYGHPNILRNEYIMNGGNPTEGVDEGEIVWTQSGNTYGYPVGTPTEANYKRWTYDFGLNKSPNGVIEYKSNNFGGKLKGKLLVCRFSGGDDIMVLEPGTSDFNIIRATEGSDVPGLRRPFSNPLDIAEDEQTGNLYISEYFDGNGDGQPRITLLRAGDISTPVASENLINAGGAQYLDDQARSWSADTHFSGGVTASKFFDVEGTTDDALYLNYRYASSGAPFSYSIPVESGTYNVKLYFIEPHYGAPGGKAASGGERVFHVDVEGQRVLNNYDIYAQEGAGKAVVKTFSGISVSDGTLDLLLTSVANNAIISGIEIEKGTSTPPVASGNLINGGGIQYSDSQSRIWSADSYFSGGETANKSFNVEGTTDDALYLNYRYAASGAPFSYSIPVEAGTYNVKLHFLEPYYGAPGGKAASGGERVFHVDLEGQRVLNSYDIYTQDGAAKAVVKTFADISVTDGKLDMLFTSVANNAIISGIEIEKGTTIPPPVASNKLVNGGGAQYVDSQSRTWVADVNFSGGLAASKSFDVEGTTDDALYLSYRIASSSTTPFSYDIPVEAGFYNVKLHFMEPYYGAPGGRAASGGDRVFHVDVEGQRVLNNYDIYAQDGGGKAVVKTFYGIPVNDGTLSLLLTSVVNSAVISAIEIEKGTSPSEDVTPPIVSAQLSGALQAANTYVNEATVSAEASDQGGAGLASVQYSLNGGEFVAYSAPFKLIEMGQYTVQFKAVDGNGNETTTAATSFSIVKGAVKLVVENIDKFPTAERMVFSLIQVPWQRTSPEVTPYNENHNKVRMKISNKGTHPLSISALTLSNTAGWRIASLNGVEYNASTSLPLMLSSGTSAEAVIEFMAKDQGGRVKILQDKLIISSNDTENPNKEVSLNGLWQNKGEGSNEPYAQEIIQAFGFRTQTGYTINDGENGGTDLVPNSDEIPASFFVRADLSKPVTVIQMAAYHGCCSSTEKFQWYNKGSTGAATLFTHNALDGQSLLPRKLDSDTDLAQGSFNPSGAFGLKVATAYSDRDRNSGDRIGLRVWKAIDENGNIIPNAYIIGHDYIGQDITNYDYNDNLYYITNIKPETGPAYYSELASTPSALSFGAVVTGSNQSLTATLKNLGGSSDPTISIKGIEIVGPNRNEFSAVAPSVMTLASQVTTGVTVRFEPQSQGLKNAALLVHYNNSNIPLRVPLYGIANSSNSVISAVKRIKGAADAAMSIRGNVWEADASYRQGSIKLDKQTVTGPIAATDDDVLYQTYLSAATNLAETRYSIPIANGNYIVRMHFVENYFNEGGAREFNITMENELRLAYFDIFKEVGYRSALVKDFEVGVTDGNLSIRFNPTANRVAIGGLEIYRASASATVNSLFTAANTGEMFSDNRSIRVYPNPSSSGDKVFVEVDHFEKHEALSITLHDMAGRIITSLTAETNDNGNCSKEVQLDNHLNHGMYLIRVVAPSGVMSTKLVVE
ncbi:malectin domain-containing carbohydrate-binding protein [Pontibacter silvestris]|uniref:Malectin domain-containing carbohydrate-binding protein n=1 Tax=Pontibacter silvestris TaxID=2305183 RepID=A0ABW4WYR2_9BACT|nr:malectin domain-containing carbohydrate-binding protein [Pontibacter silvestris]MCC9138546.1 cadherin domain-containing protein [Pontibacter silvestris]